jgi:hypothetical protein
LHRHDRHIVRRHIASQQDARAIVNDAARRVDRDRPEAVAVGERLIAADLDHLHLPQARHKHRYHQRNHAV